MKREQKEPAPDIVSTVASQLSFALRAPKYKSNPHHIYGNDIVIGYNALSLMIGYERNQTGATLLAASEDEFVSVSFWFIVEYLFFGVNSLYLNLLYERIPLSSPVVSF